jgi:hypothetical protein
MYALMQQKEIQIFSDLMVSSILQNLICLQFYRDFKFDLLLTFQNFSTLSQYSYRLYCAFLHCEEREGNDADEGNTGIVYFRFGVHR